MATTDPTRLDELITTAEAAQILAMAPNSLTMMRFKRQGPPFLKLGRRVRYRRRAVFEWIERQETSPVEVTA